MDDEEDKEALMMEENKKNDPEGNKSEKKSSESDSSKPPRTCCCACCGAACACDEAIEESKDVTCCACMPISLGMVAIQILAFAYVLWLTMETFLVAFNQYVDSYFTIVLFVLLLPLYVGMVLLFLYARSKSMKKRALSAWVILGFIIMIVIITVWILYYFMCLYDPPAIEVGAGDKADKNYYA